MNKLWAALALAGTGCLATGTAQAEPVKIAIIETLSGGQAAVGKMFLTAINYGLIKLNDEKVWPDGIKVLEYDNQGGPSRGRRQAEGGHQRRRAHHHPGRLLGHRRPDHRGRAQAQPAQPGQGDHLLQRRRRGDGVHRRQVPLLPLPLERQRRDPAARAADGDEGGQDPRHQGLRDRPELQLGPRRAAPRQGVREVRRLHRGRRRHARRQQDPGLRALRRQDQGGRPRHGGHRQLEQRPAAADEGRRRSGLKVRFATYWMDQPGNVANAGATAIGHFNVSSFYPEANGEATAKFADDFKAKTGQYPIFIQGHTVHGIWGLGEALKTLKPTGRRKLNVKQLAFAMETVQLQTPHGRGRHARGGSPGAAAAGGLHRVQGRQVQGRRHRHGLQADEASSRGKEAASPVQASCKMQRPGELSPTPPGTMSRSDGRGIPGRLGAERRHSRAPAVHGVGRADAHLRHDGRAQLRARLVLHAGRLLRLHAHPRGRLLGRPGRRPAHRRRLRRAGRALLAAPRAPPTATPTSCC